MFTRIMKFYLVLRECAKNKPRRGWGQPLENNWLGREFGGHDILTRNGGLQENIICVWREGL